MVNYVGRRKEINGKKMGIMGDRGGGMIGLMVGKKEGWIGFVV